MAIKVSFYTDTRIASEVRTAEFAGYSTASMVDMVKRSMRHNEKFASFRSPEGSVVALSHTGDYVTL